MGTPSRWREAVRQGWAGGSGSSWPKRVGDGGRGQTLPALLIFGHALLSYSPQRKEPRAHGAELLLRTLLPNPPAPPQVGYSLSRSTDKKQCQDLGSSELHLPNFPLCKGSFPCTAWFAWWHSKRQTSQQPRAAQNAADGGTGVLPRGQSDGVGAGRAWDEFASLRHDPPRGWGAGTGGCAGRGGFPDWQL